jgi:hypothetical protein
MIPVEIKILEALSVYRFVTVAQLQAVDAGKDRKHLGDILRRLVGQNMVGVQTWGTYPSLGRLPRMYHLKRAGAHYLADYLRIDCDAVPYVMGTPKFQVDHLHRRFCVDFHITLNQWAQSDGGELRHFAPYYGAKPPRFVLGEGRVLLPDAVLVLALPDGEARLFTFEMCLDKGGTDRRRILGQLDAHRLAIAKGEITRSMGGKKDNRVLSVFERSASMDAIREKLTASPAFKNFGRHFLFATRAQIEGGLAGAWVDIEGEPAPL